jgi:GAF domain-containing protein
MTILEIATIALIVVGTIIMVIAAFSSRQAFEIVQAGRYRAGWQAIRYLMVIFIAAYASTLSIVAIGNEDLLKLVVGTILLLGALAMYTMVSLVYRSAREREIISEIGRVINSSPSIQTVWDDVAELIRAQISYDRISIGTYDRSKNQWFHTYVSGVEIPGWGIGDALPPTDSINTRTVDDVRGRVMRTDLADLNQAEWQAQKPAIDVGLVAGITVPLIANNEVVAGMNLRSKRPNAYSVRDLDLVNRIADQIAGAVQNSVLHDNLEQNVKESETMAEVGRIINSSLAINEVYERFALEVAKIIPFDLITVSRIDLEANTNRTEYVSGITAQDRQPGAETTITGTLAQAALDRSEAVLLTGEPDSQQVQQYPEAVSTFRSGIRASLAVPLLSRDEIVGVLYLQSRDINAYDDSHMTLASRVATQISEGIANAELHATIEREGMERQVIGEIGRIISSSFDIEEVYEAFAISVGNLIPFDTLNISSTDKENSRLTVLYGHGSTVIGRQPGSHIQMEGTLAGETAENRQSSIVQDEQEAIRNRYPMLAPALDAGLRSFLAVPLIHNDEAIGVLQVRSKTRKAYTQAHRELADRISHQIAGAIDNARLHATLESAAREREVLAEIGRVISSSIETEDVYESFAQQVKLLLPFDRLAVTTVEAEFDRISHPYVSGIRIPGWEPGEYHPYEGSATQKVLEARTGLVVAEDDGNDSEPPFPNLRAAESSELRSMVTVPLYASNQPVGTLTLRSKNPDEYTQASLDLAQRIGNQIAGAIYNAQLYAKLTAAQEALEDGERRYRTLVESGSDVVYTADETGSFSFVAPAVERLTGYLPEELEGNHFTSLIHKTGSAPLVGSTDANSRIRFRRPHTSSRSQPNPDRLVG